MTMGDRSNLKRVLIIHPEGNTFNNPSLKCIVDLLLHNGYEIDVRYADTGLPMPVYKGVRFLPYGYAIRKLKGFITNWLCSQILTKIAVLIEHWFYYHKYSFVIGVDREGLIQASILHKINNTPVVFISFEIMFENETSARFKSLERLASKNASLWIVQDDTRAACLIRENQLQESTKFLLPLASAGIGKATSDRLRDKLNIPRDKKTAIIIGSVTGWSMTNEILRTIPDWPEDWVLIVHERYGKTREILSTQMSSMAELIDKKIFIKNFIKNKKN